MQVGPTRKDARSAREHIETDVSFAARSVVWQHAAPYSGHLGLLEPPLLKLGNTAPLVAIKTPSAFSAQPPCVYHLYEQRTRPILRIAQPRVYDAHDVETNIQPNKIRQRQKPHRIGPA